MNDETKAAMERLGKMTFRLGRNSNNILTIWREDPLESARYGISRSKAIGRLYDSEAERLGLRPGMTIQILPVGHEEGR
jgi:ATP phosphoribosyltransferase regulatory subunit HisZ